MSVSLYFSFTNESETELGNFELLNAEKYFFEYYLNMILIKSALSEK